MSLVLHNSTQKPGIVVLAANSWLFNSPSYSRKRLAAIVISNVAWTILSGVICYPSVLVVLSESEGSLWSKLGADLSATGVSIDWFALTLYGGVVFFGHILQKTSQEEKILFRAKIPIWVRILQFSLSVILGPSTRLAAITEAIKFNSNRSIGIASAVVSFTGESGLPSLSVWNTLDLCIWRIKRHHNGNKEFIRKIEKVRVRLIVMSRVALNNRLKSPLGERRLQVLLFYQQQFDQENPQINQIQNILKEIYVIYKSTQDLKQNCCTVKQWRKVPRATIQIFGVGSCIGLFIMDALLSKTAIELTNGYFAMIIIAMMISWIPLSPLACKMAGEAAGEIFDLFSDCLCLPRDDKSFADEFFPISSKLLKLLCFACSLLQYDEQIALTKLYASMDSIEGKLLAYSNIIACSLLISKAFFAAIETCLHRYALKRTKTHTKEIALIKEKMEKLIQLIEKVRPIELSKILLSIDDQELSKTILDSITSEEETRQYIEEYAEKFAEKQPLLTN